VTAGREVLAVTRGHKFDRNAFSEMLDSLSVDCTLVEQPAAQAHFTAGQAERWAAYLLYDMPGYEFQADRSTPHLSDPPAAVQQDFLELVDRGHGFVFLHHALAAWPTWPEYAAVMGGQFRFVRGDGLPDSGYRLDVTQRISVVAPGHPVVEGLAGGFEICDEIFLANIADDVTPLLVTDAELTDQTVWSAWNAVVGRRDTNDGWSHAPGSGVVAWVRPHPRSRIVYVQFGHGPLTFANPAFRRLLDNALNWVSDRSDAEAPKRETVGT
jgi:type 1 glutamine amidotransferase